MLRLTLKGLLAHKIRFLLTTFAVVIGVGFVVGTIVLTDSVRSQFNQLFVDINKGIDLQVRGVNQFDQGAFGQTPPIPDTLLPEVAARPGRQGGRRQRRRHQGPGHRHRRQAGRADRRPAAVGHVDARTRRTRRSSWSRAARLRRGPAGRSRRRHGRQGRRSRRRHRHDHHARSDRPTTRSPASSSSARATRCRARPWRRSRCPRPSASTTSRASCRASTSRSTTGRQVDEVQQSIAGDPAGRRRGRARPPPWCPTARPG